jgi:hypothetical protein
MTKEVKEKWINPINFITTVTSGVVILFMSNMSSKIDNINEKVITHEVQIKQLETRIDFFSNKNYEEWRKSFDEWIIRSKK